MSSFDAAGGHLTFYEILRVLMDSASDKANVPKLYKLMSQQQPYILTSHMGNGRNLLHCSCMFSNLVAVKALLKLDCSDKLIDKLDEEGNSPLMLACRIKATKISQVLLDHGARIDILSTSGHSIMHYCAIAGDTDFLLYLSQRTDLSLYSRIVGLGGSEPLHLACRHGNTSVVQVLLRHGALPNHPDGMGRTPLFLAVQSTNKETIEYLQQNGAQFNLEPEACKSLMSGLISRQSVPCVKFMMGIDLRYVTAFTKQAFDLPFEATADTFVRSVIGSIMEENYPTSIEMRREMEERTRDELKRIVGGEPFPSFPDELRKKTKRFISWLAYCNNAIEYKNRRANVPDYVTQNKAHFPGFFQRLWRNPKPLKSAASKKAAASKSNPYLHNRHAMDDAIWSKLQKRELSGLSERAKCFLLDCYYQWSKGTQEEEVFCKTIPLYKEEIKHVLDTDSSSLHTILCFLGALAKIPELDDFISDTLYQCDLSARRSMFYDAISGGPASQEDILDKAPLVVDRYKLFETSCEKVRVMSNDDLRTLTVTYLGEEGQGVGVKREWLNQLIEYLLDFRNGLFTSQNNGLNFQPSIIAESILGPDTSELFHLAGKIIAFSLLHGNTIKMHFTGSFYKHILGFPLSYKDQEPEQVNMMEKILKNDVSELGLTFSHCTRDLMTEKIRTYELIPGGADIPVTEENKARYVELRSTYIMTESIKPQIDSFAMGFHSVIPKSCIRFFKGDELELLLCGLPDIDISDLKNNTEYPVCETTQWFWKVVRSMQWERKQKLLLFWTAYPRVPYGGFKSLDKPLKIEVGDHGDQYLPQAHTCFKILKLSNYSSKSVLKKNLITSIEYGYVGHGMP